MFLEAVRLAAAVLLLVVLPGYVAVQAMFPAPRSQLSRLERAYLVVAAGIVMLILVGVALGSLPTPGGRGMFQTLATGFPHAELWTLAASAGLFYVGLQRGAYPRIAARFPGLARAAPRAEPHERA